jgi:transposase
MGYDKVFRKRAVLYSEKHTIKETVEAFGISRHALTSWQTRYYETGNLANKPLNRTWRKIDPEKLRADVAAYPDAFYDERAARFGCSGEAIRQALQKLKITRKKRVLPTGNSPRNERRST